MNCLKCGRETKDGNVFCEDCLTVMEKHPVKPGTSLQLPRRAQQEWVKKPTPKKRQTSPEEKVLRQRKTIRRMALVIAVLFVAICVMAGIIAREQLSDWEQEQIGRNYTSQTEQ